MQDRYRMRGGSLAVAMLAVVVLGCYANGEEPAATRGNQQTGLGSLGTWMPGLRPTIAHSKHLLPRRKDDLPRPFPCQTEPCCCSGWLGRQAVRKRESA